MTADGGLPRGFGWCVVAAVLLALVAGAIRVDRTAVTENSVGWNFWDNDTARRLARLEALETQAEYPAADPREGPPDGVEIHWTLPMDWLIQVVDAMVPAAAGARANEVGAAWAGPVLAALCVFAFAWMAMAWLGFGAGLIASVLYALSTPLIEMSAFGNGDHQNLQHLTAVVAVLAFARVVQGRDRRGFAWLAGVALGGSLWVSAESMALLFTMALAMGVAMLVRTRRPRDESDAPWWRGHATWAFGCVVVVTIAAAVEQRGRFPSFEWDRVSGFQLALALAVLGFALVAARRRDWSVVPEFARPLLAAVVTTVALVVTLVATPLGAAALEQWETMAASNRWTQTSVREYQPLLSSWPAGGLDFGFARLAFTELFFLLPVFVYGVLVEDSWSRSTRGAIVVLGGGLFAFTCLEVKLAHLFAIVYPVWIVVGGRRVLQGLGRGLGSQVAPSLVRFGGGVAVLLAVLGAGLFEHEARSAARARELAPRFELAGELARRTDGERSVLAIWELGAALMYHGRTPVVASGYHRNLEGIRDAFAFWTRTRWDEAAPILERRNVRWVVWQADPMFLTQVGDAFPDLGRYARLVEQRQGGQVGVGIEFDERAAGILWRQLMDNPKRYPRRLRVVYESAERLPYPGNPPAFRLFEVLEPR